VAIDSCIGAGPILGPAPFFLAAEIEGKAVVVEMRSAGSRPFPGQLIALAITFSSLSSFDH